MAVNILSFIFLIFDLLRCTLDVPSCCRITFIGTTSRKLALQWFPYSNGNSEIKRYNITLINEHSVQDYAVSGTKTMMSFDGLSPGQRYQIFITAENAIGASNTSNAEARMLEEGKLCFD